MTADRRRAQDIEELRSAHNLGASFSRWKLSSALHPLNLLLAADRINTSYLVLICVAAALLISLLDGLFMGLGLRSLYLVLVALVALHARRLFWPGVMVLLTVALRLYAMRSETLRANPEASLAVGQLLTVWFDALVVLYMCRGLRSHYIMTIRQAAVDPDTGALTSHAFRDRLEEEIAWQRRYGGVLSLAVIDIDALRQMQSGQQPNGKTLAAVSEELKKRLRRTDVFGRMPGSEFAILLLNARSDHCIGTLEQLRQVVSQRMKELGLPQGSTVGCSTFTNAPGSVTVMITAASEALEKAQKSGNSVIASSDLSPTPA